MATITMLGLYNYDPTLFDLMTLPADIDPDLVRDNILLQSAEFEVLYPNPNFTKQAIKRWADKWYFTFEKWVTALAIQYDPLNNYDRYEEYEDTGKETRKDTGSTSESVTGSSNGSETGTSSGTNSTANTGSSVSGGTTDNKISAYDSATMREDTQQSTTGTVSDTSSGSSTSSANDSRTTTGSNSENRTGTDSRDGTTDRSLKHKAHLYGNIGVTTSQQMLEAELQIARFNLVDQITDCFINEFCIRVYD